MSCNIRIPIQQIIDDVAEALSGRYISVDNPFLNEAVLTDTTLRGDITADTKARDALCGILQTCGITAVELEWLDKPLSAGLIAISQETAGGITVSWESLDALITGGIVGKVFAKDVLTDSGATQETVNTQLQAAVDDLPFVLGKLPSSFVTEPEQFDGEGQITQQLVNGRTVLAVSSIADMLTVKNKAGRVVTVSGAQGGTFVYDSTKSAINDGGYIFDGWVRQLQYPKVTPEMFGAKGDATTDDANAIRRCVASCVANKIKAIVFGGQYLINTPRVVGQETLLIMSPNISYIGIGGAEFIVGDDIPDKFHILAAVHSIITTADTGNVIVSGIKFTSKSDAANMSEYTSNLAIHTFGLNNVLIQNCTFDKLDLSNVIACGIRYEGVDYGSKVIIRDNKFLSVTAENVNNIDHSSIYMQAPNSFVVDNLFKSSTLQNRKVACGVECHASNLVVARNQIYGYSRGVWLAASPATILNCHVKDNIAHVSNHFVILTATSTGAVGKCSIEDNIVRCEHATTDMLYITYQGLLHTSGMLDPLGWMPSGEIVVRNNQLNIDLTHNASLAVIAHIDQFVSTNFVNNVVYGAVGGFNTNTMASSGFSGNVFYNQYTAAALNKDFFIQVNSDTFNDSQITDNIFYFASTNRPAYLIGMSTIAAGNFKGNNITNNRYGTGIKPNTDLFLPPAGLSLAGNKIDVGLYNVDLSIPALTVGEEVAKIQNVVQNVDGMYVYLDVVPDDRFYMLVDRGTASTSFINIRLKGLQATEAFTVPLKNVRVKSQV